MKAWILAIGLGAAFPAGAYWKTDTTTLQAPHVTFINKLGGEKSSYQLSANRPARFTIEYRRSLRWAITSDSAGSILIFRSLGQRDSAILQQRIVKGLNDVRLFCEPDEYQFVATVPCRVRLFAWQVPNITSLVPVGGGFPVPLLAKDGSTETDYHVAADTSAGLKVMGPALAYVYVRPYAPLSSKYAPLDVEVREGDSVVTHLLVTPVASSEVAFAKPIIGYAPGKPSLVKLRVPKGLHVYQVRPMNDRALVRFSARPLPDLLLLPRHAPVRTPEPELSANVSTGVFYDDNVYDFGARTYRDFPAPDSLNPGPGQDKYSRVRSLGDVFLPLEAKACFLDGSLRARGSLSARKYGNNAQLDQVRYSLAVGWRGPEQGAAPALLPDTTGGLPAGVVPDTLQQPSENPLQGRLSAEIGYFSSPSRPVRPAFSDVERSYSLLAFTYHRVDICLRMENPWHPELRLSGGLFDYLPSFDYLDAIFFETTLETRRERNLDVTDALAWNVGLGWGDVIALRAANYNWSNVYITGAGGAEYDRRQWTFGLNAKLTPRFFSTATDQDPNRGRIDLEFEITPVMRYHFRAWTVSANVLALSGRKIWAANAKDELAKSYSALSGGVGVSSSFDALAWVGAGKG